MPMPELKTRIFFMAFLACLYVLTVAPSVWSEEANQKISKQMALADSGIMAHYEMMGHTEEALHASRSNDLRGATTHVQTALKAGESYLATAKVDPGKQKGINEGIQSLKEALKFAQSGDAKGFQSSTEMAMSKFSPEECHGVGCNKPAGQCGCGAQLMQTCDPLHPTRKCTTVGCECFCM